MHIVRNISIAQAEYLDINDMREVIELLWDYRAKWRFIGMELGIKAGDLDAIEKDTREVGDALYKVTKQWLSSVNPKPTRTALKAVLESKCVAGEVHSTQLSLYGT